ncbi:MAG: DNA repair protein RecO C-terminal domain-containing protein, partial [bacterium]
YRRLCAASYMGQTAAHCVQEDDAAAGPFELLAACLGFLDSGMGIFKVLMLFEIRFLKELGMLPELSRCLKCQGSVDRAVSLDPREGGVVHLDCAPVRDDLRLTVGDLSAVKFASSRDLSAVGNLVVKEDQAWRIFSSIHAFAVHHLGYESRALRLVAPKDAET